jgi:hypothetical protein
MFTLRRFPRFTIPTQTDRPLAITYDFKSSLEAQCCQMKFPYKENIAENVYVRQFSHMWENVSVTARQRYTTFTYLHEL